ncbi:MAG: SRPBCC domain-containing protein [Planctomycetota bacterium]
MTSPTPGFRIERSIDIDAPLDVVFGFVSDPRLFAAWFGAGSTIDASVGGAVEVVFPGGARAVGEVLAVEAPRHIRFTWGYPREDSPVAPGASTVDVHLDTVDGLTRVTLSHVLPTQGAAEAHIGGWAYHLARLAAKAARERARRTTPAVLDAWFAAWSAEGDDVAAHLARAMTEQATYRDDAVHAPDRAEVAAHIGRCHAQMKGSRLERVGAVLHTGDRLACRARLVGSSGPLGHVLLQLRIGGDGRIVEAHGLFEEPVPGVSDGPLLDAPSS